MIRPTGLVYWNLLKSGVDEFSRALKSLCYTNSSENPIVSVIGRLLVGQINNCAVVHRFTLAKGRGLLPGLLEYKRGNHKGYSALRHDVARCGTFAGFARLLAKDFMQLKGTQAKAERMSARRPDSTTVPLMKPLYIKDDVTKYNREADKERRLTLFDAHKKVKHKSSYCSLCSYSFCLKTNGKSFKTRGGSRQKQWCSICRQLICSKCWVKWHTEEHLEKASIPTAQRKRQPYHLPIRAKGTLSG